MRLAYLFSRFPVVSQTFCDSEMLALQAAGVPLVIGSLNPPPNRFRHERLAQLRAEVIYPPPPHALQPPPDDPLWLPMADLARQHLERYGPAFKPLVRARNAWHFAREFQRRHITHLHVHFANRATHTALFLHQVGFSFSFTAHAQDFMVDLGNDDLLREMMRAATFTAAVSDYSRNLLLQICPDAAPRIHRVYNGIDAAQFPRAQPAASSSEAFRLISIGRLIDFKGFPILLEAVAALVQQGLPIQLQIIGEGPQRPALEAQIDRLQLRGHVRLRGTLSQEQIKQALAASHAFVLASLTDAKGATDILPTVILEAMACGLPVVSTTLAGIPEMVLHRHTGLLAPPADAPALAAHLATLAQDPDLRARLGSDGLQRVQNHFALHHTAAQLASLFPSQASLPPPPAAPVLALLDHPNPPDPALAAELDFLHSQPAVALLATRPTAPLPDLEFLPDATVLESHWFRQPELVAQVEALRPLVGPVDSELFYLAARRAVYLATQVPLRHWQHIHALRAASLLPAWLLHHLTGLPLSATLEANHQQSRTVLAKLLPACSRGSHSDPKLPSLLPDLLQLAPPPKPRRRFLFLPPLPPPPPTDPAAFWLPWLASFSSSSCASPSSSPPTITPATSPPPSTPS